jgi:outer membrane lipoprotein-sorting protein
MKIFFSCLLICSSFIASAQMDANTLIQKVKAKLDMVNDYSAEGKMKTDVAFIKAPIGKVKIFFKKPNLFKLKKDAGISILPKGGVSVNMNSLMTLNNFTVFDAGQSVIDNINTRIIKLLPLNENSDVILTTMYIDEKNLLVKKAVTTTRENGTYEILMNYGNYANYGLPDKVIFAFNTKDYKMPKGITFEFDDDMTKDEKQKLKGKKGKVEINYTSYSINKGIDNSVFN